MVQCRVFDIRWVWRYRFCYIAGITIMSIQIFLAVIFFTLYEDVDKSSKISHDNSALRELTVQESRRGAILSGQDMHVEGELGSEMLGFPVICNVSGREMISAINRAKTPLCKQLILNTTCTLQNDRLYPEKLPHLCPANGLVAGKYVGCFRDSGSSRLLNGAYYNASILNSPVHCLSKCTQAGFSYAGVQFGDECFCGSEEPLISLKLEESQCNILCPSNISTVCGGYLTMNIYETGMAKFGAQLPNEASSFVENINSPPVRIVFLLTLNGRAIRQVYRLIKILFHRDHFFFIHVDGRQDFMFRELLSLEMRLSNVRLSRRRHSTIWGGASLLTMLLQSMSELIQSSWDWDFLINLSESDFPIKTNKELVAFLSANRNRNFVKSHGRDVHHFIHKQGLDKTFIECDEHMWRIGNKVLPSSIVIDGGSDWIALSRPFINYVITAQNDDLLEGLKLIYKYTLLPAESFFHTVLRNSIFCDSYIDNNLHVTNWKRHLGCKCQYKHVVDWCGCSPNVFTLDDWSRIQATLNKSLYFARKFDPIVSQLAINRVQEWLYGPYGDELSSEQKYWQNVYHHSDRSPTPDDALRTVSFSLSRQSLKLLPHDDLKCPRTEFQKLLQVHTLHLEDIQKGVLVNFNVMASPNKTIEFEVWYRSKSLFSFYNTGPIASRFMNLVVNTHFDAKEKISRNYVGALGPFSEPVLIYQVVAGLVTSNITVVWISPVGNFVDVITLLLDELPGVNSVKLNTKTPLWPGKWTVYLVHYKEVVARVNFVVSPLEIVSGNSVTIAQAKSIHAGTLSTSTSTEWKYLIPVLKGVNASIAINHLEIEAIKRSSFVGIALSDWIDQLISESYEVLDLCFVKPVEDDGCYQTNFKLCKATLWSSFSPDPKTHITTVNKLTGRLN